MSAPTKTTFLAGAGPDLHEAEFKYFCEKIGALAGINLSASKYELLKSRLRVRLAETHCSSYQEYRKYLERLSPQDSEWQEFINVLTTNKTDFFREPDHFKFILNQFLPEWLRSGERRLRVWSAASSTGEEPYTLAMVLNQALPSDCDFEIVASDIDTQVLSKAMNAVYPLRQLTEIPERYRSAGVDVGQRTAAGWFRIKPELREKVQFCSFNLLSREPIAEETFDLIFCRNVMIYFSVENIGHASANLFRALKPGGLLMIGHSESLHGVTSDWQTVMPSIYQKKGGVSRKARTSPGPLFTNSAMMDSQNSKPVQRTPPEASVADPVVGKSSKRKVLIVDDSKTIRDLLCRTLNADPDLEVIGSLSSALEAKEFLKARKPDVITLDVHMPGMNGVDFLKELMLVQPLPVVMISSLNYQEGNEIFRALELGAVDYIQKPSLREITELGPLLCEKVKAASQAKLQVGRHQTHKVQLSRLTSQNYDERVVVVIGASTGGTEAIKDVLAQLPPEIPPTLIVQHIPAGFSTAFAERLNKLSPFEVKEACDGDELKKSRVLIAPGGQQMAIVRRRDGQLIVRLTDDPPMSRHKPSVDYLFLSAAKVLGAQAIGVILTGMGNDGTRGLLALREAGAKTLAQDESTSVVYGMPKAAYLAGAVDQVVPLMNIAAGIMTALTKGARSRAS